MTKTTRLLIGLLAVAVLLAAFPLVALAQSDETQPPGERPQLTEEDMADRLADAKERIIAQIERRLEALDRMAGKVDNSKHITDTHAATLKAEYAAAEAILTAGIDTVAAVETIAELREVAPPIFESTLVFALLGPKTHAVIASDAVVGISDRYDGIAAKLQDALDRLAESGIDVDSAQTDLDAATAKVVEAVAVGGGVADQVIGLQPGDEIAGPLADARAALGETRALLREARDLTKGVAEFIRSHLPQDEG